MSSIDERVVRMEFDNKQFESGVSTTMSTLEKLKESLRFRESTAGFDDIQKASSNLNFSSLNDRLWQVQQNFSFFGEFVETVFTRISNKIIDVGSMMVRELTTAPLQAGYSEYELMMGSLNTIMASAAEREGKSLEDVIGYLDQLNTYADKTIYSFSDMTQNIGKFTNAGVPLEQAVKAIQGISNEAAVSGANAQQASHAMYNFAQALSSGYVKLIDWRSIETANMATVEFRQQLLDTAVELGTVERTADGMYRVLGTNANGSTMRDTISATKNFNDSLAYQWMTSDVLTTTLAKYADETTEIGQKAFKAATEVKTFSQLIDTVKESLGSGWTKSFQYMIGDLDEAKVLWTGVNEEINAILDPIAEAREEMLKFWHDNGGRAAAIQAISDAWQGLKAIMTTLSSTFEAVFPPMTGERLVEITKYIGNLASRFKQFATSTGFLMELGFIFKGFLVIARGALSVLGMVAHALSPLIGIFADFGSVLFDAVYRLGLFTVWVSNAEDPVDIFQKKLSFLTDGLRNVVVGFENFVKALLGFVGINIDGNPITNIFDSISEFASTHFDFSFMNTLASAGNGLVLTFGAIGSVLSSAINGVVGGFSTKISKIADALSSFTLKADKTADSVKRVGDSFDKLGAAKTILVGFGQAIATAGKKIGEFSAGISAGLPNIFEFLGSQELRNIINNFNALMGGGLLLSLRNFLEVLSKGKSEGKKSGLAQTLQSVFGDVTEKAGEVFEKLTDALSSFQESIKANVLLKIAIAVGILAVSLSVLSSIDAEHMANGVMGMATTLGVLVGALAALDRGAGTIKPHGISVLATALIKMAIAVGVLTISVKALSKLDMDSLTRGLVGVGALLGMLIATSAGLSHFGGNIKKSTKGLISFAIAVGILTLSVKSLAKMNVDELERGLIGVVGLMGAAVVASIAMSRFSGAEKSAKGLIKFAIAIGILGLSVRMLAGLNMDELERGLIGVGGLMAAAVVSAILLSRFSGVEKSAKSMLVLSASIVILAQTVKSLAQLNLESLVQGLAAVGSMILAMSVFAIAVGHSSLSAGAAVSIVVLTGAILILAEAVKSLGGMSLEELGVGMLGLAGGVLVMVVALKALQAGSAGAIAGAAALMVMSVALRIFLPVLTTLAGMDVGSIVKGLLSLAAGIAVLGLGSVILSAIAPAMFIAAAGIGALGIACGALGLGIGLASAGVMAFAAALATVATSVVTSAGVISVGIVSLITAVVTGLVNGLVAGVTAILNGIAPILEALTSAIHAVGTFLISNVPYILSVISTLVISVLSIIPTFIPQLVEVIVRFVVALLQTIITWLPIIAQTLVSGVVTLINSVANGIRDNSESILAAVRNILSSIIELVLTALADIVRMIPGVGDTLAGMIESGRDGVRQSLAPESFEGIAGDAMDAAVKGIEQGGVDLSSVAEESGSKTHDGFLEGLGGSEGISEEFMGPILDGFSGKETEFFDVGALDSSSFVDGFGSVSGSDGSSDALIQSVLGSLQGHEGDFASAAVSDAESYASGFENSSAGDKASSLAQSAAGALGSNSSLFSEEGTKSAEKYATALGNGKAKDKGASLASSGASGASSKRGAYSSAGTDMAAGFNYGIASPYALSLARSAGARLGQTALDGVRSSIRSASPSKETMKLGKYTSQGFAIGIKSLTSTVYKTSENVGQQAIDGIKDSLGTMAQYLDEDLEVDPTIRPVMDLSEIQNGVTQMNRLVDNGTPAPFIGVGMDPYARMMMSSMLSLPGFGNPSASQSNETVYNLYIDGARINDDIEIRNVILDTFDVLGRKGAMNVGNK